MNRNQKHLNYVDTVNLGSYYTPEIMLIWLTLFYKKCSQHWKTLQF